MKKLDYFIPIYGIIKIAIKPYENDDAAWTLTFLLWHLSTSCPLPLLILLWIG